MPKNFILEERIERFADVIELNPVAYRGRWAEACAPAGGTAFAHVHLDLGCGKGIWLAEAAKRDPDTLFIGVDSEPICIVYAAENILKARLCNAVVIPGRADDLARFIESGEIDALSISFPTPFPRKKQAALRVTQVDRLLEYRALLAPGGTLTLRTDSRPLFDFSLAQLEAAGYRARWLSHDTRAEYPEIPTSEYEQKLSQAGAVVHGICAEVDAAAPDSARIDAAHEMPQSLFDYLPDDLYEGAYVPHGMDWAIQVFRNRKANEERRRARRAGVRDEG